MKPVTRWNHTKILNRLESVYGTKASLVKGEYHIHLEDERIGLIIVERNKTVNAIKLVFNGERMEIQNRVIEEYQEQAKRFEGAKHWIIKDLQNNNIIQL